MSGVRIHVIDARCNRCGAKLNLELELPSELAAAGELLELLERAAEPHEAECPGPRADSA